MIIAVATAVPLLAAAVLVLWTAYRAHTETLPRNFWVGVRTRATLRSANAWRAGHLAAVVPMSVGGIGLIVAAMAAVFVGEDGALFAAMAGCAWIVVCFLVGSVRADRAASRAEDGIPRV